MFAFLGLQKQMAFLNVGIAGGSDDEIGKALRINKIMYEEGSFYPDPNLCTDISGALLVTVNKPQDCYPEEGLIDMEGAAFFKAANQFVSKEQIGLLKVISDNHSEDLKNINGNFVSELIEKNLVDIERMVFALIQRSNDLREWDEINRAISAERILEKWHFTQYQRNELKEHLWKCAHLGMNEENIIALCENAKSAEEVFMILKNDLQ